MAGFSPDFDDDGTPPDPDGRLDAAAFHRNHEPIREVLAVELSAAQGDLLEIGSGTGQHACFLAAAFPGLVWWPSDPSQRHRRSIAAWAHASGLTNLRAPLALDASSPDWPLGGTGQPPAGGLRAILAINVVHIAPWSVARGLVAGAGRHLAAGGTLYLYGPFRRDGRHTAPSNEAFDGALRRENPDWGVRDLEDIVALAKEAGLVLDRAVEMPANNLMLVLSRAGASSNG